MKKLSRIQKYILLILFLIIFSCTYLYLSKKRQKHLVKSSTEWIESYQGSYTYGPMPKWFTSSPGFIKDLLSNFIVVDIESINLSRTSVSIIASLEEFPQLKYLNLEETKIGNLDFLISNKYLEELKVGSSPISDLSPLLSLPALTKLDISETNVSDFEVISNLNELNTLAIRGLDIQSYEFLFRLKKLKTLEVDKSFSKEVIEKIRKLQPDCNILISP